VSARGEVPPPGVTVNQLSGGETDAVKVYPAGADFDIVAVSLPGVGRVVLFT
jgi:hypothetical protein